MGENHREFPLRRNRPQRRRVTGAAFGLLQPCCSFLAMQPCCEQCGWLDCSYPLPWTAGLSSRKAAAGLPQSKGCAGFLRFPAFAFAMRAWVVEDLGMSEFDAFEIKMRAAGMGDAPVAVFKRNYEALLRDDEQEREQLRRDLLIRVTEFFREPETFSVLRERVFPAVLDEKQDDSDEDPAPQGAPRQRGRAPRQESLPDRQIGGRS